MTLAEMVRPWESEAEQVRTVAERWWKGVLVYETEPHFEKLPGYYKKQQIYTALLALPETATAADVAAIIGNTTWVGQRCTFCGETRINGFDIGEPADYESATVSACTECAEQIARIVLTATQRASG